MNQVVKELSITPLLYVVFRQLELYISSRFRCEFILMYVVFAPLYSSCNKAPLLSEHASWRLTTPTATFHTINYWDLAAGAYRMYVALFHVRESEQ